MVGIATATKFIHAEFEGKVLTTALRWPGRLCALCSGVL